MTDNPLIRIFVDEIENRITLRIKTGYYFVYVTLETIKLLGKITSNNISADGENVPHLEVAEVANRNILKNGYQHNLRVLHALFLKKLFGQLLDISPKSFICLNSFNSEFSKVWFTDQNSNYLLVKGYGFLPFAKNITKNIGETTSKNLSDK